MLRISQLLVMISMLVLYFGSDSELAYLILIFFFGALGLFIASFIPKVRDSVEESKKA